MAKACESGEKQVFQKIDTDKDGTLSLEEFQQAFTELEMSPSCSWSLRNRKV